MIGAEAPGLAAGLAAGDATGLAVAGLAETATGLAVVVAGLALAAGDVAGATVGLASVAGFDSDLGAAVGWIWVLGAQAPSIKASTIVRPIRRRAVVHLVVMRVCSLLPSGVGCGGCVT
jgi:hypothetical protein